MKDAVLHLGDGFTLPLGVVSKKIAILAKSGAGKTTAAADIVEEVDAVTRNVHAAMSLGVQCIILDPKGDWWGLRASADGKGDGLPVLVLGGQHGDVPLEADAGAFVAEAVVDDGRTTVLDVSGFSKGDLYRFVGAFGEAFYRAKTRHPTPCLLVLEEADEVAPQKLTNAYGPSLPICLGAIEKIVKRGRFIGIGVLMLTQRSASLNKDILTQADVLVAMKTTAPKDIKAVDEWLSYQEDQTKRKELLANIQSLKPGEAYIWDAEADVFQRVRFRHRRTYDAGRTPRPGEVPATPKRLAPINLDALRGRMAEIREQAKANDPKTLQAEVKRLRAELEKRPTPSVRVEERVVEKPVPFVPREIQQFLARLGDEAPTMARLAAAGPGVLALADKPLAPRAPMVTKEATFQVDREKWAAQAVQKHVAKSSAPVEANGSLTKGQRVVLQACAEAGVAKGALCVLTGYRRRTRDDYLQQLRAKDYVAEAPDGTVTATVAGVAALGDFQPLPTGAALLAHWRAKLPEGERRVLDVLAAAHPSSVLRSAIDEATGYARRTRDDYIARLASRRLVVVEGGEVWASDLLFG